MNITKKVKICPEKSIQSKPSFLIISTNYQIETLSSIISKNPSLINTKDQKGETFLSYAIKRKEIEKAELILSSTLLDYSFQDNNGNSYLHLAVINHLENIAKILIEKGININLQNNEGNTALHFAYSTGDNNLINLINEHKADLNIKNKNGLIGKEIKQGTFPEILDVSINYSNHKNVINNNSNTIENINQSREINNLQIPEKEIINCSNSNNDFIINEKGQLNKSIKMNWDNNEINGEIKSNSGNIMNNSNNIKQSLSQQNSQLKLSLVNFSYSEDPNEEENLKNSKKISEIKNSIQSSDIFDLVSSVTYKEKLAKINNSHKIVESKVISNKDSSELNNNEDIVNININNINNNQITLIGNNSINVNNIIQNGIQLSQMSFQTSYENGKKNFISNVINNYDNDEKGMKTKSEGNKDIKIFEESLKKGNGGKIILDFCKSLTKEEMLPNQFQYNKKDSEGLSFNDYNNKSNLMQSKVEINENFAFSPFATLRKTSLNNQINGSEVNKDNIKDNIYNNSNNFSNININDEIKNLENNNNKELKTLKINNKYSPNKENGLEIKSQKTQNIQEIETKNDTKINFDCPLNSSQETFNSSDMRKNDESLYNFLSEIRKEKYYSIMKSNGFDDIQLLINQTKNGNSITDKQLKLSGINIPGDRAKILIKLQEKAGNFIFPVPKEVYYIYQNNNFEDKNINKLKNWLDELKVGIYLENFIKNGYHSLELMMLQMESKNPITDEILKDEIGIDKIGHRSRIINKLNEDAKSNYNKWKTSILIIGADITKKICDCNIF